jgi:2-phosphoglycerate kinase
MHDEDAAREKYMLDVLKEFQGKNAVVQLGDHHLRSIPISKGFLEYTGDTEDDRGIVSDLTVDNASPVWEYFANRKDTCISRVPDEYKTELAYAKQAAKRKAAVPLTRDEQLTIKNLKRAETANIDKFGQDRDHNALYIAGYSGSGKSTTASGLARKNDKIIRLDFYADPIRKDTKPLMDKEFNAFLEKKGIDYKKVANAGMPGSKNWSKYWNSGSYWKEVAQIRDAIEEYSKEQYDKGNRVIVEGVQIQGDWLAGEKNYYKGKPIMVLRTPAAVSIQRGYMRDGITGFNAIKKAKESVQYYKRINKKLDDLVKETDAIKNGKDFVDLIYKKGGV